MINIFEQTTLFGISIICTWETSNDLEFLVNYSNLTSYRLANGLIPASDWFKLNHEFGKKISVSHPQNKEFFLNLKEILNEFK